MGYERTHRTPQYISNRPIEPSLPELAKDNQRSMGPGTRNGSQIRIDNRPISRVNTLRDKNVSSGIRDSLKRNWKTPGEGSYISNPSLEGEFISRIFVVPTNNRPSKLEQARTETTFQNGGNTTNSRPPQEERLVCDSGFERRIFCSPNPPGTPEIPSVSSAREEIPIQLSPFRLDVSPKDLHQTHECWRYHVHS